MMHQSMIGLANYLIDGGEDGNARHQASGNCCRCERPNWIHAVQPATVTACRVDKGKRCNFRSSFLVATAQRCLGNGVI